VCRYTVGARSCSLWVNHNKNNNKCVPSEAHTHTHTSHMYVVMASLLVWCWEQEVSCRSSFDKKLRFCGYKLHTLQMLSLPFPSLVPLVIQQVKSLERKVRTLEVHRDRVS